MRSPELGSALKSALRLVVGTICVGKERFHLLPEKWIAVAGAFDKGGSLKRTITFDGIGQDRFHLLPSLWCHTSRVAGETLSADVYRANAGKRSQKSHEFPGNLSSRLAREKSADSASLIPEEIALIGDLPLPADETDAATLTGMIPDAYEELRRLAAGYLRDERPDHTLQPTALVHEVYLRLMDQSSTHWQNRAHFLGIAARMMRRILINHAKAHTAEKRGGTDAIRLQFDEALDFYQQRDVSLVAVDAALHRLEELDKRQAQIVEFRFFGGLTVEEIAKVLAIAPITVKREWATAKLWLQRELAEFG